MYAPPGRVVTVGVPPRLAEKIDVKNQKLNHVLCEKSSFVPVSRWLPHRRTLESLYPSLLRPPIPQGQLRIRRQIGASEVRHSIRGTHLRQGNVFAIHHFGNYDIYNNALKIPPNSTLGIFNVSVENALEAPRFILGEQSNIQVYHM